MEWLLGPEQWVPLFWGGKCLRFFLSNSIMLEICEFKCLFTQPLPHGQDLIPRSIFKQNIAGLNSVFVSWTQLPNQVYPCYLPITGGRRNRSRFFLMMTTLVLSVPKYSSRVSMACGNCECAQVIWKKDCWYLTRKVNIRGNIKLYLSQLRVALLVGLKVHWDLGCWWSTPSLPLFPGLLWLRVAVPVRVWSMGQTEMLKNYLNSVGSYAKQKNLKKQLYKKCKYEHTMIAIP